MSASINKMAGRWACIAGAVFNIFVLSACGASAADAGGSASGVSQFQVPASDGKVGPLSEARHYTTDLLIYDGTAAAYYDDDSLQSIAESKGLKVKRATSAEINNMTLDDLAGYGAIVWPGGYADEMSKSLTADTRGRIRQAVLDRGVGYMGICAGAWMGVGPKPSGNPDWGLALVPSPVLDEWTPPGAGPDDFVMVDVKVAGQGKSRNMAWWGGPKLPEIPGGVMARYGDGTPAMVQTWEGHGFVVLTSPHPEAPQIWRDEHSASDSDGLDFDLALGLMKAAMDQKPLQTL